MSAGLRIEGVSFYWERKALEKKLEDIRRHCQDALEDAVLMGCDEEQVRSVLMAVVGNIENPYRSEPCRALRAAVGP